MQASVVQMAAEESQREGGYMLVVMSKSVIALGPAGSLLSNSFLKLAGDVCKLPAGSAPESTLTSDFVPRNSLGIVAFIEQKYATDN